MSNKMTLLGGAAIGNSPFFYASVTWPCAGLSVTESHLFLRFLWKRYSIDVAKVAGIRQYNMMAIRRGVQILHTAGDCPRFIVFWTMTPKHLLAAFRRLGYPVLDQAGDTWKDLMDSMG
jgi:hypothetical protein